MVLDPIERYPWINFPIEVSCNPILSTMPSGKRWAIAGGKWIEVPLEATREDLPKWMVYKIPAPSYEEVKVEGSKGNTYTVSRNKTTGKLNCTCPGFKYRGNCKHLKLAFPS